MSIELTDRIQEIFKIQKRVIHVHPFLSQIFPIAVVEDDQFFIFDCEQPIDQYRLVKQAKTPMTFPPRLRAAFPLPDYSNRMACVVTKDVFDSQSGYVTIFHEFIHCLQGETCEHKIRTTLKVAQDAQDANDHMWELNYPFPYDSSDFIDHYESFLELANKNDLDGVLIKRRELKQLIGQEDYEYMVWQEWKEGFARLIENMVKRELRLDENHGGTKQPFSRVLFYEGGAKFIELLAARKPTLTTDIEILFDEMLLV